MSPKPNIVPRFRFAPSPTGYLHLGHVYSALRVWEAAEQAGGEVLLRIEDIDTSRARADYIDAITEDLAWLGFHWTGDIRQQSLHMHEYQRALDRLTRQGVTYPCFCTRRDIRTAIAAAPNPSQFDSSMGLIYPGTCRHLTAEDKNQKREEHQASGAGYATRLDIAAACAWLGETGKTMGADDAPATTALDTLDLQWHDSKHGVQVARPAILGDVVLDRKDTRFSYHLSVVVDDAIQGITHVVRGMDLFDTTPVHVLLQRLLGLPTPRYRHHELITDDSDQKLSKRRGAPAIRDLRAEGQSAEAVLNAARTAVGR